MENLKKLDLLCALHERQENGAYFMGICLGFQLFAEFSTEGNKCEGLNWLPSSINRLTETKNAKVPHVGWNSVVKQFEHPIANDIPNGCDFYFVHSYHMKFLDNKPSSLFLTATCGQQITAAVIFENIFGVQFHPEKSQENGLKLLKNWYNYIKEKFFIFFIISFFFQLI